MARARLLFRRSGSLLSALAVVAGCAWLVASGGLDRGNGADGPAPAALARASTAPGTVPAAERTAVTPGAASTSTSAVAPGPARPGDDPVLDDLWQRCGQGSGAACDQLFQQAPVGTDYEAFGLSCGNRPDILHCGPEMDAPSTTAPPPTFPPPPPSAATR